VFQSPLGEVVKETYKERVTPSTLKFQSPLGEVVKETKTPYGWGSDFSFDVSIPSRGSGKGDKGGVV